RDRERSRRPLPQPPPCSREAADPGPGHARLGRGAPGAVDAAVRDAGRGVPRARRGHHRPGHPRDRPRARERGRRPGRGRGSSRPAPARAVRAHAAAAASPGPRSAPPPQQPPSPDPAPSPAPAPPAPRPLPAPLAPLLTAAGAELGTPEATAPQLARAAAFFSATVGALNAELFTQWGPQFTEHGQELFTAQIEVLLEAVVD